MAQLEAQEVRIAMAMNGGVSLAVWIGGVTREFARLLAQAGELKFDGTDKVANGMTNAEE